MSKSVGVATDKLMSKSVGVATDKLMSKIIDQKCISTQTDPSVFEYITLAENGELEKYSWDKQCK